MVTTITVISKVMDTSKRDTEISQATATNNRMAGTDNLMFNLTDILNTVKVTVTDNKVMVMVINHLMVMDMDVKLTDQDMDTNNPMVKDTDIKLTDQDMDISNPMVTDTDTTLMVQD